MSDKGIVQIHGREYMTVARRVELAHEDKAFDSLDTQIISHDPIVVKAFVTIKGKTFTGISAVSLGTSKMIEKQNPYEVAETSAVGRALGFAGYGIIEGIASADEVTWATRHERPQTPVKSNPVASQRVSSEDSETKECELHGDDMFKKWSDKKQKFYWYHTNQANEMCFGQGFLKKAA